MKNVILILFVFLFAACPSDTENGNNKNNQNNANNSNNVNNQNNGLDVGSDASANNTQMDTGPDVSIDVAPDLGGDFQTGFITFFELPIGSIRWATSMVLADEGVTVTAIWAGTTFPACDEDFNQQGNFPYIYVEPTLNPMAWDYSPNATYTNPDGCVEFETSPGVGQNVVDLKLDIESVDFTGSVWFKDP